MIENQKYKIPELRELLESEDQVFKQYKFHVFKSVLSSDPQCHEKQDYAHNLIKFFNEFFNVNIKIEKQCPHCNTKRVFLPKESIRHYEDWRKSNGGIGIGHEGLIIHEFECSYDSKHRIYYVFKIDFDTITKIGQFPKLESQSIDKLSIDHIDDRIIQFELIENTRGYIEKIAKQAILCFSQGAYDASLIIDLFGCK